MPDLPDATIADFVLEAAESRGDHPALVDGVTGESISYAQLRPAVSTIAANLAARGVGPGDVVALMAANQPLWAATLYGITATGAAAAPVNPALKPREKAELLNLVHARLVVTDGATAAGTTELPAEVEVLSWPDLLAGPPPEPATTTAPPAGGVSDRPAVIAFSSGTTGRPKGVVLTNRNLIAAIVQHGGIYHVGPDDRFLAALPLFHIYGLSMILDYGLRHGATIVTLPRFDLPRYLDLVERHRVTWLHLAPPLALQLVSEAAAGADLSSVRHAVSGAAPLDGRVAARARERLGTPVGQGYGMTEASPGVTWVPDDASVDCPPGSVGVLIAGTEARLVDPSTGADTAGPGELWVRGPQIMAGYFEDPAATQQTLTGEGWLRTGDIARVDDSGVWWIVDRLKELIKYKGYQVAPAELEAVLLEHPLVSDAAVVGAPDPAAGEIPTAWVVADASLDAGDLMGWVAGQVAPYKRIRSVHFVDTIPRSPAGKILRRELRAMAPRQDG